MRKGLRQQRRTDPGIAGWWVVYSRLCRKANTHSLDVSDTTLQHALTDPPAIICYISCLIQPTIKQIHNRVPSHHPLCIPPCTHSPHSQHSPLSQYPAPVAQTSPWLRATDPSPFPASYPWSHVGLLIVRGWPVSHWSRVNRLLTTTNVWQTILINATADILHDLK